jgi:hypothetical protein
MNGNTVIIARGLSLYDEGQMGWPLSRSTYCVINQLLTGLLAARSLARIPSGESISPVRHSFRAEEPLIKERHIGHRQISHMLSIEDRIYG